MDLFNKPETPYISGQKNNMGIFNKGDYKPIPADFRTLGIVSLQELSKFQEKFEIYDTDTTINSIRDAIVANYLCYDLLNFDKHGFTQKKVRRMNFLKSNNAQYHRDGLAELGMIPMKKKQKHLATKGYSQQLQFGKVRVIYNLLFMDNTKN